MPKIIQSYPDNEGIMHFMCPACNKAHHVTVKSVSEPNGWDWNRDTESPSLEPSIRTEFVTYDRDSEGYTIQSTIKKNICHSWMTRGRLKFFPDCTHELAGTQWHDMLEVDGSVKEQLK